MRKKAKFLRWKISRGDLALRHSPGLEMLADLGTKPLQASRLEFLREKMGMFVGEKINVSHDEEQSSAVVHNAGDAKKLQLALLAMMLVKAAGQGEELDHEQSYALEVYTLVVVALTTLVWWLCMQVWRQKPRGSLQVSTDDHSTDPPHAAVGPEGVDPVSRAPRDSAGSDELRPGEPTGRFREIYVTKKGLKYHLTRECVGLMNASHVTRVRLCDGCGSDHFVRGSRHDFRGVILYSLGPFNLFHSNPEHGEAQHGLGASRRYRPYGPCAVCALRTVESRDDE